MKKGFPGVTTRRRRLGYDARKAAEVKGRKRCIQTAETLIVGEITDLKADKEEDKEPAKRVRTQRRCGRSGETGHNPHTCAVESFDAADSYGSELCYSNL